MTPKEVAQLRERVVELLICDPETGVLIWRPSKYRRVSRRAGCRQRIGYRVVRIDGVLYYEHRIIWVVERGEWPEQIDHINGVKDDNRLVNLRPATHFTNRHNNSLMRTNTSGIKGVRYVSKERKWTAEVWLHNKKAFTSRFNTKKEAIRAIRAAREELHGEFANHG